MANLNRRVSDLEGKDGDDIFLLRVGPELNEDHLLRAETARIVLIPDRFDCRADQVLSMSESLDLMDQHGYETEVYRSELKQIVLEG